MGFVNVFSNNTPKHFNASSSLQGVKSVKSPLGQKVMGQSVEGKVVDINNKSIKIKIGDQVIEGRLDTNESINIGDIRKFLLDFDNGVLKMRLMPTDTQAMQEQHLENALKDLGELSKENLKFAKMLLESNLPVNKETLKELKRNIALFGKDDAEALKKSLLMMKNEISPSVKNTQNMNSILDRSNNITQNLQNIDVLIDELGDDDVATQIKNIFTNITDELSDDIALLNKQTEQTKQVKSETKNLDGVKDLTKMVTDALIDDDVTENGQLLKNTVNKELVQENVTKFGENAKALETTESSENSKLESLKNLLAGSSSKELAEGVQQKNNNNLESVIKQALSVDVENEALEKVLNKEISKSFGVDKEVLTPKHLEEHINEKLDKLEKALEVIKNSSKETEVLQQLEKEIVMIKDKLSFANEIKNNIFVQIPFTMNDKTTNGELIVFKDKKNKRKHRDTISALVSLDTANLGLFEAYVVKKQDDVDIQFRFAEDFVKPLVQNNSDKLNNLLKIYNIRIKSLSYKKIDEPFSLLEKEPSIDDVNTNNNEDKNQFKFDVRG